MTTDSFGHGVGDSAAPHGRSRAGAFAAQAFALAVGIAAVVAVGVLVYDASRSNLIVRGTKVGGIDVGAMTPQAAAVKLDRGLAPNLQRSVFVAGAGKQFELTAAQSQVRLQTAQMAQSALTQSRGSNIFARAFQNVSGVGHSVSAAPGITYSAPAVSALVAAIQHQIDQPVRDATVIARGDNLVTVPQADGLSVDPSALSQAIVAQLANPGPDRSVAAPINVQKPHVTADQLPAAYPAYIIVDRSRFKLLFFKNLKLAATYPIAVGMQGLSTPAGLHHVEDKQVNPSWHVPNSSWAGALAGRVIPPGPQDPLKARWMGIGNGDGIHGTDETGSIGTAGSHGCIRMLISNVVELYSQVPTNSPVYVE